MAVDVAAEEAVDAEEDVVEEVQEDPFNQWVLQIELKVQIY